jgi:hypothetical protein
MSVRGRRLRHLRALVVRSPVMHRCRPGAAARASANPIGSRGHAGQRRRCGAGRATRGGARGRHLRCRCGRDCGGRLLAERAVCGAPAGGAGSVRWQLYGLHPILPLTARSAKTTVGDPGRRLPAGSAGHRGPRRRPAGPRRRRATGVDRRRGGHRVALLSLRPAAVAAGGVAWCTTSNGVSATPRMLDSDALTIAAGHCPAQST